MEINPNLRVGAVQRPLPDSSVVRRTSSAGESAEFSETQALNGALASVPEVRVEVVERAQKLIGDVNYPPAETIRKLASLLAIHMERLPESSSPGEPS